MQQKCTNVNSFRIIMKTLMLLVLISNFNAAIIVQSTGCNRNCEVTYKLRPWEFSKPKPAKPVYPAIGQRVVFWTPYINYQAPSIFTQPIQPVPINNYIQPTIFTPIQPAPIKNYIQPTIFAQPTPIINYIQPADIPINK